MQDSSTEQLIFGIDHVVSFLSQTVTLEPGDVIATGTPPGVGFARKPPVFLKPGDVVEVEVEGLGVLSNPVVADSGSMTTCSRLDGIRKRFGPTVALDGVSFALEPGQVHALIGENGAGKSTLMNVLAGALQPDEGEMRLSGDAVSSGVAARREPARRRADPPGAVALPAPDASPRTSCSGGEPSRGGFFRRSEAEALALDVLGSFSHPELRPDRPVGALPIAAQQVVEICRAVASHARIVLMDEPTSSLQRDDVEHLFALIRRLRGEGIGIIYISHFLEEVRAIADVFTVLRDGRSVATGPLTGTSNESLVAHMVGRSVDQLFPDRHGARAGRCRARRPRPRGAARREAGRRSRLRRGEILGLAGLMGSGPHRAGARAVRPGAGRVRRRAHRRRRHA